MKVLNVLQIIMVLCIFSIMSLIPGSAVAGENKVEKKPDNAALVNGKAITYKDFEWELAMFKRRMKAQRVPVPEQLDDQLRTKILDDMIRRELIYQQAVKQGIKVSDEWLKQEMSAFQKRFSDPKQFEAMLSDVGLTEEKLKEQFVRQQIIRELIGKEIVPKVTTSEADAKSYYEENPSLFLQPEEVKAQHILIKVDKGADEKQKAQARKTLLDLKKRIDAGEDFGELAKANSQGPSAPRGGDLGYFSKGRMVPSFEKAAFALKPNQVSDIVETQFGYHLIKVVDRKEAQKLSFEDAKPRIMNELRQKGIQTAAENYADELRKTAKIETFIN